MPVRLRTHLLGHDVFTVGYLKWKSIANGHLLSLAKSHGFEVVVASDGAVEHQQNLSQLPLSIINLHPESNAIDDILPLVPQLMVRLGEVTSIPAILHVYR
jgi:hypothetical protein